MDILNDLYNQAVNIYHVNPFILEGFFILSLPFYYPGYYMMIKAGYKYYKNDYKKTKEFDLSGLLKSKGFIPGLIINRFGWVLPYLYLMIVGRNLPIWTYFLIILWLGITTYLIIFKTKTKVIADSITYKIVNKDDEVLARKFLSKRYGEVNFISKSEARKPYYDEYIDHSVYFVAKILGEVVGVIRVVENSKVGLPILNDFKLDNNFINKISVDKKKRLVEIGNLAAVPKQNIARGLYIIVIKYCIKNKLIPLARIDKDLLNKLRKKYWLLKPFIKEIGKTKRYPGEICVPVKIKFNRFMLLFI